MNEAESSKASTSCLSSISMTSLPPVAEFALYFWFDRLPFMSITLGLGPCWAWWPLFSAESSYLANYDGRSRAAWLLLGLKLWTTSSSCLLLWLSWDDSDPTVGSLFIIKSVILPTGLNRSSLWRTSRGSLLYASIFLLSSAETRDFEFSDPGNRLFESSCLILGTDLLAGRGATLSAGGSLFLESARCFVTGLADTYILKLLEGYSID